MHNIFKRLDVTLKHIALLAVILMFSASCARIVEVDDRPRAPEVELFETAEEKFAASEYNEALDAYEQYLETYPEAGMVPAAILKIGMIHTEREEYEDARAMYERLIETFPGSVFARWAEVERLFTYFQEGRYETVVDYAEELDRERFSPEMKIRIAFIVGDAYEEKEAYDEAFDLFLETFSNVPEAWRPYAGRRLAEAASRVHMDRLEAVVDDLDGAPPTGYLIYGKGLNLAEAGRIRDAVSLLSAFTERFSDHPLSEEALEKIEQLEETAYFEGRRIGVLLPLTGEYETFGRSALRGIEIALMEYSDRGEHEAPLEILVRDTGADEGQVVDAVAYFAEQKVAAIIGPIVMASPAAKEAQARGIPIVSLSQRADITQSGDYVFRNFLTPQMQVDALVEYTTGSLALERFAVLYPDEEYGETFLHLFWDRLIEEGGRITGVEKYDPEKTDFSDPIKKLVGLYYDVPDALKVVLPVEEQLFDLEAGVEKGQLSGLGAIVAEGREADEEDGEDEEDEAIVDFDAVFIPDSPRVSGMIIPQLRYYDISDVYLLGTNLWHSEMLIDIAGRQLRQVVIPEGFFSQSRRPHVDRFVGQFTDIYGEMPGFIEASGFDTAMILFEVMSKGSIDNRIALKQALLDMPPFMGITGETVFDESGEAVKDLYLLKVSRGRFLEIRE